MMVGLQEKAEPVSQLALFLVIYRYESFGLVRGVRTRKVPSWPMYNLQNPRW